MDGVLNITKPKGWTSHDVVQKARGILRERRIGHTGTLDPLATGVLVLCVGKATRIARYLEAQDKEYRVLMKFGIVTDTLDSDGRILETRATDAPSREQVLSAIRAFTGSIMQRPPAFSAVKVNGVPSHRLARKGKPVELKQRPVLVHDLQMTSYEYPFLGLSVKCSKGTYVRVLCADIGEALGPGAHVTELERTRAGEFTLDRSINLEELEMNARAGTLDNLLISMDNALANLPGVEIRGTEAERISHGNPIPWTNGGGLSAHVRVHDQQGELLAVARAAAGKLEPEIVFSRGAE